MRFMYLINLSLLTICFSAWGQTESQDVEIDDDKGKPKWEVGVFGGLFDTPTYPGSGENQNKGLLLPYVIYRGDVIKVGDGAIIKAVAVDDPNYELDVSLSGAFNVDDEEDSNRDGMPNIDYLFGIGPEIIYHVVKPSAEQKRNYAVDISLQTRAIFSTDFSSLKDRGYVIEPEVKYRISKPFGLPISLISALSVTWASEQLQDYLYQVDPIFSTPDRRAFDAKAGWLQGRLFLGLSKGFRKQGDIFLGLGLQTYEFAENKQGPLIKDNFDYTAILGFRWRLWASKTMVK